LGRRGGDALALASPIGRGSSLMMDGDAALQSP
jgi:hypothetical protein